MRRWSVLAGLSVCVLGLGAVGSMLTPRLLEAAITERIERAGATANVAIHPLEFAVTMNDLELQRGTWSATCTNGRAAIAPRSLLGDDTIFRAVAFESCEATRRAPRADAPESGSGERPTSPLQHLQRLPTVRALTIDEVRVIEPRGTLSANQIVGTLEAGAVSISAEVDADGEIELHGHASLDASTDHARIVLEGHAEARGAEAIDPRVTLGADGSVFVEEVRIEHPLASLNAASLRRTADGAFELANGHVEFGTLPSRRLLGTMLGRNLGPRADVEDAATDEAGPATRLLERIPAATRSLDRARSLLADVSTSVTVTDVLITGLPRCQELRFVDAQLGPDAIAATLTCDDTSVTASLTNDEAVFTVSALPLTEFSTLLVGTVDVQLSAVRTETGVSASSEFDLDGAGLHHTAIAATPVELIGTLRVTAELPEDSAANATEVSLNGHLGPVPVDATATAEPNGDTWALRVEGGVTEPATCQDMWSAVPDPLVPSLRGANPRFSGSAAPRLRATYDVGNTDSFDMRQDGFMGDCVVESLDAPFDPSVLLDGQYTHLVTDHVSAPVAVGPGSGDYVTLSEVPSYVPALMHLSEEIAFFDNPGFSMMLMRRAVRMNLRESRYVYGGSTVSQQLVKNLFFTRDKTLARKFEEAIVVWAMEQTVSKERILELYMNCVEFAPDVYGVSAAARHYFGKPVEELTPLEAAWLAALKPAPSRGEHHRRRGHSPDTGWWHDRLQVLLERLVEYGPYIDEAEVEYYSPYIVAFPTSENFGDGDVEVPERPRPKWAAVESFAQARERITGVTTPAE